MVTTLPFVGGSYQHLRSAGRGPMDAVFERFTDPARRVLVLAQEEARELNHRVIGTEHIVVGLVLQGQGVAAQALASLGISPEAVREAVEGSVGMSGRAPGASPPFTPPGKKALEWSRREALVCGTPHM
jgi:ATP-dependent Clp protease ATP-binding subunit ClpC